MTALKERLKKIPILGSLASRIYAAFPKKRLWKKPFAGSERYWEERYASGGNSGAGSYEKLAVFKAEVLNNFVAKRRISSVIEFGCGDGNQLALAEYPSYLGIDVSETVVSLCRQKFASDSSKTFKLLGDYEGEVADLALSLDVIYHLVEDHVFERHMQDVFRAARHYVIVYSSNTDEIDGKRGEHVRHREFSKWVDRHATDWKMIEHIPNRYPRQRNAGVLTGSLADFFIYEKV